MDNDGSHMIKASTRQQLLVKLARLRVKEKEVIAKALRKARPSSGGS